MPLREDPNALIAALLRDLARVQRVRQKRWGYARAAEAIADLPEPITAYLQSDGTLRKIPNVGPSSTRIVLEVLRTGTSESVARALDEAGAGTTGARDGAAAERTFLSRAQVLAALNDRRLRGVALADYRGDLQMHSTYSDGRQSIADIAGTGLSRGYAYSAVTDHSYGLPVANGVSMRRLRQQHREIDRVNRELAGRFRVIKGIEANVLADGTVDMTAAERRRLELVIAAPHSALRSSADQSARLVAAVQTPGVHILGHPRGRKLGARAGVQADWDRVFEAAARAGVAVEIDGDPSRQDLDHVLARRALDAGCLFALDSDAHRTGEWVYAETAVAHARLARVPADRVINCWELERLLDWAAERRGRR